MTKPEVIVFDLGKVLLDFDYAKAAKLIAANGRFTPEQIGAHINQSLIHTRFETGHMTEKEFLTEAMTVTGFQGTEPEFAKIFCEIFEPIPQLIDFHASLKKRGIPTFIFSNTNILQLGYIRRTYPFFGGFDDYILSFEHGAMKPQEKLYEVVEQRTRRRGEQILYIDDRPENILAGAARDWQTILQEHPEKTLAALKLMGLA
jgi:HAD superfamily hydrolase (TIGR01509 family)